MKDNGLDGQGIMNEFLMKHIHQQAVGSVIYSTGEDVVGCPFASSVRSQGSFTTLSKKCPYFSRGCPFASKFHMASNGSIIPSFPSHPLPPKHQPTVQNVPEQPSQKTDQNPSPSLYDKLSQIISPILRFLQSSKKSHSPTSDSLKSTLVPLIQKLYAKISTSQIKSTTPFDPPFSWYDFSGLYPSNIHINFHGPPIATLARNDVKIPDSNVFVTLWVTSILLELDNTGTISYSPTELNNAINAIVDFKDKNFNVSQNAFNFWKQKLKNKNVLWETNPENLLGIINEDLSVFENIKNILTDLDLEFLWPYIQSILNELPFGSTAQMKEMKAAFRIPGDFDDTSLGLGLAVDLYNYRNKFPEAFNNWNKTLGAGTLSEIFQMYVEKSYKPFSKDTNQNSIDPRTYYFMRDFLALQKLQGNFNLTVATTWIWDIKTSRSSFYSGVAMPFNVNNVDGTVCANVLMSITKTVLSASATQPETVAQWFNQDVRQLYRDTAKYLSWMIETDRVRERPDLGMLYYPSIYNFYWFASRTVQLLNNVQAEQGKMPFEVLEEVRKMMNDAMTGKGTQALLEMSQIQQISEDESYVFWDDFLGTNDQDWDGETVNQADDRLFSTAVSINALLDIWTQNNVEHQKTRVWRQGTKEQVKNTVLGAVKWLSKYILSEDMDWFEYYLPENAFFSGSGKSMSTMPFLFPANYLQYLNYTNVPQNATIADVTTDMIDAVSGVIDEEQYSKMIEQGIGHFNLTTPVTFPKQGFNADGWIFPYWSSPSMTYASAALALAKFYQLE